MSTTATTTRKRDETSSSAVASSTKFKTFAITFAVVGTLTYCVCLFWNWPVFTYHPAVNRFDWGMAPARSGEGPAMYWYGWTVSTLVVGAIAGFLATLLPESTTRKFPLILVWLLPILSIPYLAWDLKTWWLHP